MALNKKDIRLKGHESFYIREGWITKGLKAIKENSLIFSDKNATDILGVGTGMVKSIKYWLSALELIEKDSEVRNGFRLSTVGEAIYVNDLYIEDIFTLWILHYNLTKNFKLATSWNIFSNKFYVKEFTKDDLNNFMKEEMITLVGEGNFSEKSLFDDCSCIIKSYLFENSVETPEENFKCPFAELGLLEKKKNRYGKEYFIKKKVSKNKFNKLAALYIILDNTKEQSISIDELIEADNNIGRLFNLDRNDVNELIDSLEKEEFLTINRTAGLNTIYLKDINVIDVYYSGRGR